jgi:hypothetical protein
MNLAGVKENELLCVRKNVSTLQTSNVRFVYIGLRMEVSLAPGTTLYPDHDVLLELCRLLRLDFILKTAERRHNLPASSVGVGLKFR